MAYRAFSEIAFSDFNKKSDLFLPQLQTELSLAWSLVWMNLSDREWTVLSMPPPHC